MDTRIDGIVLDVLTRKHKKIFHSLGISVSVPVETNDVVEASLEGRLLRGRQADRLSGTTRGIEYEQAELPGFEEFFKPEREKFHALWNGAAKLEQKRRSQTKYAQEGIARWVEEVSRELDASSLAVGSSVDVHTFVHDAQHTHRVPVVETARGLEVESATHPHALAEAMRIEGRDLVARSDVDPREGETYLTPTHPLVEGLASYVLDTPLDPLADARARRCGVIRTGAVQKRTMLPLIRLRFHLVTRRDRVETPLLAEDCPVLAFEGSPQNPNDVITPLHLVGCGVDLDTKTPGVQGASRHSPHSLLQQLLNRRETPGTTQDASSSTPGLIDPQAHDDLKSDRPHRNIWGFVSTGVLLRVLREKSSLTRQSYVEFDLETMMDGGEAYYSDFVLLFLLCHESRIEGERPEDTWLEKGAKTVQKEGIRSLDELRQGVKLAISTLGRGLLDHPANTRLRDSLRAGTLSKQDYYHQLLLLVYRLLFLFAAEDRDRIPDPSAAAAARERYLQHYSTQRLRRTAHRRRLTRHPDLFRVLTMVMKKLGDDAGCPDLALYPLGSVLWSDRAVPDLEDCDIANQDLLDAVRAISWREDGKALRPVDNKNMGAEKLGRVYESLLQLQPDVAVDARHFDLRTVTGSERTTTGSYYTPSGLIVCSPDSALDPVLDEAGRKPDPAGAILDLKVCDPACGSGHFLIAAAHHMARRLAAARTEEAEPSPVSVREALRDVIGHCIYGVDLNEMAVEVCNVSLWMDALTPGKPLAFLDHHVVCSNSLLGATPALTEKGISDEAFTPFEGDDKAIVARYRKVNKRERGENAEGPEGLLWGHGGIPAWGRLERELRQEDAESDASATGLRAKEERYARWVGSSDFVHQKRVADAWCAAFVWKKTSHGVAPITQGGFLRLRESQDGGSTAMRREIDHLAEQYHFLHWNLLLPDVSLRPRPGTQPENEAAGCSGGFDVVLCNPPWERIRLQEQEWSAERTPDVAKAANAANRKRDISSLKTWAPEMWRDWQRAARATDAQSHLTRTGESKGVDSYTAPELLDDPKLLDPRTAIYSIGAVWYEPLVGQPPRGLRIQERLGQVSGLSREHRDVILTSLDDVNSRFPACEAVLQRLRQ